jgi:glycosyltransferase involved in cell wall biosynthesis
MTLTIDIDASRAAAAERTGTERYSSEVIRGLLRRADADGDVRLRLYSQRPLPDLTVTAPHQLRLLQLPRLWTHLALGPASVLARPDLLFVPAHVVPLLHPPTVVTIHDLGYHVFPEAHTARRRQELIWTTRWSSRAARQIIAISQATKDDLVRRYGVAAERVSVVHLGVADVFLRRYAAAQRSALRERLGLQRPFALSIGTIQPRKNLLRLLQAFARLIVDGRELDLVLVGRRGWLSEGIVQHAAELGIAQRVHFSGYLADEELVMLLQEAAVFAFPSLYEGFGIPVLEAMAAGCAVVTSTTSSLPEVAGDAALLVDPLDVGAIAGGLAAVIDRPELRQRLQEAGRRRAALFPWQRCADRTLEVLRAAAGR